METITYDEFTKVEIRVGRIVKIDDFPEARKPAYKLQIDFGKEMGIKNSSAQITKVYSKEDLLNRLVMAVVNFPPKQIANFKSEVLTLGVPNKEGDVVLLMPDKEVEIGVKMF